MNKKVSWVIPGAIIAAGVILAIGVYLAVVPSSKTQTDSPHPERMSPVTETDHVLGSPAAKVKIVEYSDFDCPHCSTFNSALHHVVSDYGASGKVAWVSRNFAIIELHPNAKKHAEAAECVARVAGSKAYFAFGDLLFQNQPANPLSYAEYAQKAGALPDPVASCVALAATNGIDAKIDSERQNAIDAGARGTPYSIMLIEGRTPVVIDGAWSYADLKDAVAAALESAS